MRYFFGIEVENLSVDIMTEYKNLRYLMFDTDTMLIKLEPYSVVAEEMAYYWRNGTQSFEIIKAVRQALFDIKGKRYEYMLFDKQHNCISAKRMLIIGECMQAGIICIDYKFNAINVPYNTLKNDLLTQYDFINNISPVDIDMLRLPTIITPEDRRKSEQLLSQIAKVKDRGVMLDIPEEDLPRLYVDNLLSLTPPPEVSMTKAGKVIPLSAPNYLGGDVMDKGDSRIYVCFPPISIIGVGACAYRKTLYAVRFLRVERISNGAFRGCKNLYSVIFPERGNIIIESNAFADTAIKVLRIPASVKSIASATANSDNSSFANCPIERIEVVTTPPDWMTSKEAGAFTRSRKTIIGHLQSEHPGATIVEV